MKIKYLFAIVWTICFMYVGTAFAHSMLISSSPANHEVLHVAPKSISLTFAHPTKLMMIKLMKGKDVIPVSLAASEKESMTFSVPLPVLTTGQYEANWSTLSGDGHPMKGTISFSIVEN